MDKLISGIAVAALSGLTFLAYKHHSAFRILGNALIAATTIGLIGAAVWDMGAMHAFVIDLKFIDANRLQEAQHASQDARLLNWPIFAAYAAACGYVMFLFYLPQLLGEQNPPDKQGKPKRK